MRNNIKHVMLCMALLYGMSASSLFSQEEQTTEPVFKPEELEQVLAPIALYPDSVISQVLMASTYPLEVVQADRWVKQNPNITGDKLATALEQQTWDPSVKSLVNFPDILAMMSDKLDWTQKLGDAFLAQQKEVMDTIQKLRRSAQEQGNLETTEQQVVKTEQNTIIIESADPQVVYIPSYNPTVVYGTWPYPAYPPYAYYPPGHFPGSNVLSFGLGMAVGSAWGYAWGDCDWHGGDIDIDVDRNLNANRSIDRSRYRSEFEGRGARGAGGETVWRHDPIHREGVAYRDTATAGKFNRASSPEAIKNREAFRGRAEQGRQEIARGDAAEFMGRTPSGARDGMDGISQRSSRGSMSASDRGGALKGMDYGKADRKASSRGSVSRQRSSSVGAARPSGSRASRPSGGGGRARSGGGARGGRR